MDMQTAVRRLSALAHDGRLNVIRLLIMAGPDGMPAGDIARELSVASNTMSAQLLVLSNAQLVKARREGRSIIYSIQLDATRDLLAYLVKNCCQHSQEICVPPAATLRAPAAKSARGRKRATAGWS